jgi:3-deoxy-manno-octulosonate cytidylyltransferase (CMP-KDO synthetase)
LEQLRWLENGLNIQTKITTIENLAIDTPDDLKK